MYGTYKLIWRLYIVFKLPLVCLLKYKYKIYNNVLINFFFDLNTTIRPLVIVT